MQMSEVGRFRLTEAVMFSLTQDLRIQPEDLHDPAMSNRCSVCGHISNEETPPLRLLIVSLPELALERQALVEASENWGTQFPRYPIAVNGLESGPEDLIPSHLIDGCDVVIGLSTKALGGPNSKIFQQFELMTKPSRLYLLRQSEPSAPD